MEKLILICGLSASSISYEADVVDIEGRTMYLWGDGKHHIEPSK